jgi:hypothetical protein
MSAVKNFSAAVEPTGGQPPLGSKPSVPDLDLQVATQRAFEAVLWAMPAVACMGLCRGIRTQPGMADNIITAYSRTLLPHAEVITGNTVTPYIAATTDLRNGPVVIEVPARSDKASLYGQVMDAWQLTLADVGPAGIDKGDGAKYLLLPPGYDQVVPDGYVALPCPTYRVLFAFRSVPAPGATEADAYAYTNGLQMYPLAEAATRKPVKSVDGSGHVLYTLPHYDIKALHDIHEFISVEPVRPTDKVMMGMLASIGIERGKPFEPKGAYKDALERGVRDAYFYTQQLTAKLFADNLYWPDRQWSFVMVPDEKHGFAFETDDAVHIDRRAAAWCFYTLYPKLMIPGKVGTVYLAPIADKTGTLLAAGKNYRVRIPKDVPARQFWSLTVYDNATWSFIRNPLDRSGRSSLQKDEMTLNADGSVDLYFGPDAPKGLESNWIPTMGKKPYLWFRLYAPAEAFWDKSFKLDDVELLG